jgi:hypothetical protein
MARGEKRTRTVKRAERPPLALSTCAQIGHVLRVDTRIASSMAAL